MNPLCARDVSPCAGYFRFEKEKFKRSCIPVTAKWLYETSPPVPATNVADGPIRPRRLVPDRSPPPDLPVRERPRWTSWPGATTHGTARRVDAAPSPRLSAAIGHARQPRCRLSAAFASGLEELARPVRGHRLMTPAVRVLTLRPVKSSLPGWIARPAASRLGADRAGSRPDMAVAAEHATRNASVPARIFQAPHRIGADADHVVAVADRVSGGLDPGHPRMPGPVPLMLLPAQQMPDPVPGQLHDGRPGLAAIQPVTLSSHAPAIRNGVLDIRRTRAVRCRRIRCRRRCLRSRHVPGIWGRSCHARRRSAANPGPFRVPA